MEKCRALLHTGYFLTVMVDAAALKRCAVSDEASKFVYPHGFKCPMFNCELPSWTMV